MGVGSTSSAVYGSRRRLRFPSVAWLVPAAALTGGFFLVPMLYAVYLAFTNLQLLGPHAQEFEFTGLENLTRLIHDPSFWHSTKLTAIYVIGSGIIAQTILGLVLALLMQRAVPAIRISVGGVLVLAWVLPEVTAAFLWYAFAQEGGTLGLATGRAHENFLVTTPMLIVSLANTWRNTAFSMLILSAGLRNIPQEVDEAAQIEGAGYLRRLFFVVLPMMRPIILTNLLLITLTTLANFALIFVMTQGGPGNDTSVLAVFMYIQAFQFNALGYGTMVALAMIVIGASLSLLYVSQFRSQSVST